MTTQDYYNWRAAGSPWSAATPIVDFSAIMRSHGYTVYVIGSDDANHLQANSPEDHCPYSWTGWPGKHPYPKVLAADLMPGGAVDWRRLGEKIVADKNAGVPGTEWIKYVNYTDRAGNVWHASWQPNYSRHPSTDGGHIHISGRTDYVNAHTAYDPVARLLGIDQSEVLMALMQDGDFSALAWRVEGLLTMRKTVQDGPRKGEANRLADALERIERVASNADAYLWALSQGQETIGLVGPDGAPFTAQNMLQSSRGAMSAEQFAELKASMPTAEDLAAALLRQLAGAKQ